MRNALGPGFMPRSMDPVRWLGAAKAMNDHAAVREQPRLAAVQPGGLDRLTAGDTTEAATLAGHLAGCPSLCWPR